MGVAERPEAVDMGSAVIAGTDTDSIIRETLRLFEDKAHYERMSEVRSPFGDGTAAKRTVEAVCRFLELERGAYRKAGNSVPRHPAQLTPGIRQSLPGGLVK